MHPGMQSPSWKEVFQLIRLQHSPGSSAKYNTPFDDKATIPCPSASSSSSIASPERPSQTFKTIMRTVISHLSDLLPVIIFPHFIYADTFEDRILPKTPRTIPRPSALQHMFWLELSRILTTMLLENGSLRMKVLLKLALQNLVRRMRRGGLRMMRSALLIERELELLF